MKLSPEYDDELIDIVDEQDQVVSTVLRSHAYQHGIKYTRIVLAFIVNKHGKLGLLRRTADKTHAPSCLALIGGGVQSGEDYLQACKREVLEEALLDVDKYKMRELGYRKPQEDAMGFFKMIYEVQVPYETISFNEADFSEIHWFTPLEALKHLEKDKKAADLDLLIREYYK